VAKHGNIFDAMFDRIDQLTKRFDERETGLDKKLGYLELEFRNLLDNQESVKDNFKSLETYQNKLQKDLLNMDNQFEVFQDKLKSQIQDFNDSVLKQIQELRLNFGSVELEQKTQLSLMHNNKVEQNGISERVQSLQAQVSDMSKWIHLIEKAESNLSEFTQREQNMAKVLEKVKASLDDKENTIMNTERYVDVYMPIKMQIIMSETLGSVFSRQQLQRLDAFENEKFKQLNDNLLDAETVTLETNMKKLSRKLVDYTQKFTLFSKKASHKKQSRRVPLPLNLATVNGGRSAAGGDGNTSKENSKIGIENQNQITPNSHEENP